MHLQAWLNHQVTATKEVGAGKNVKQVPVYKTFNEFFDYQKALKEVEKPKSKITPQMRNMARIAFLVNSGKEVNIGNVQC
ncbi:hypothetical protein K0H71_15200 [Bacillus sp. IITD106]|nr:hypothetical protein [Bacillus sp. IITD106]